MAHEGKMQMTNDQTDRLVDLIKGTTKHGNYQQLPPTLPPEILSQVYHYDSVRLESARFEWLDSHSVFKNKKILEIGANTGYFSIRAASERGASSIAYEPDPKLAEAMRIISCMCNTDNNIEVRSEPFTLTKPELLPQADLIINLNVIHHAGFDFDQETVKKIDDWKLYAIEYLKRLTGIGPLMVFQTGYTWGGGSDNLCPSGTRWHPWTKDLLKQSGWNILACGIAVKDIKTGQRSYVDLSDESAFDLNVITNRRNGIVSSVGKVMSPRIKNIIKPYVKRWMEKQTLEAQIDRFALRPLYICKRS